jgi:hypothetical protein
MVPADVEFYSATLQYILKPIPKIVECFPLFCVAKAQPSTKETTWFL